MCGCYENDTHGCCRLWYGLEDLNWEIF
jgi:hypothetical protein